MSDSTARPLFGPFVPVLLLALSLTVLLTWEVSVAVQQHVAGLRVADQQQQQFAQAAALENRLRQILQDLVELGGRNAEAAAIVKRYGISFGAPTGAAPAASTGLPAK